MFPYPAEISGLKAWFDASAASYMSTSTTTNTAPGNGGNVNRWLDQSGNGYHATKKTGQPKWDNDGFNGKGTIDLTNDSFTIDNSASDFDGWEDLTVVTTLYQTAFDHFCVILGKSNQTGWANSNSHPFAWTLNVHRADYTGHKIWGPAINTSTGGNTYQTTNSHAIWTHSSFTGGPSVLTMRYSSSDTSNNLVFKINGSTHKTATLSGSLKSQTSIPVGIGGEGGGADPWTGRISELMIFNARLDDNQLEQMESYLANKYEITSKLPAGHLAQPVEGADISLHWGTNDGGTNESDWVNTVSIGKKSSKMKIWLDASDANSFTLSGSAVTAWNNKAGESFNFDQKSGDPSRVASTQLGNVVNFDGNDQLWTNDPFKPSEFTMLSVARYTGGGNGRLITSKDRNWLFGFHSNKRNQFYFEGWINNSGTYDTEWHLHAATVNNQDQANCWTDLTKLVTDNTSAHNSNYQPSKLSLGAYSNVSEASKGEVAELIAFDSVLSTADRQKIEGYLAHKWGLSSILPNTHPAKSASIITSPADIDTHTVNLSNLVSGNTYYYRVKVTNSEGTDWADSTASFTSESALSLNSGNLLFDTSGPTPSWSASDGTSGNGVLETLSWTDSQSNTIQYKSAKYSFESLTIGDGVNVTLMGDNPIHIDITGDGTINAVLDANGSHGNTGYLTQMVSGNLGGGEGGSSWFGGGRLDDSPKLGTGPTHLVGSSPFNSGGARKKKGTLTGLVGGQAAGGGSYGGSGARSETSGGSDDYGSHAITGGTYGNINVDALLAGSGGGGGWMAKGGTGGGAIKITAGGTLTIGADIFADGGQGGSHPDSIADGMSGSLQFWYDSSDPQTVIKDANGKVSYWNDKVSNRHLAQATGTKQPTHGTRLANGKTVMDFDGGDWMESINNVPMSQSHFQLWVVAQVDSVNNENDSIFAYRETSNDYQFCAGHASNFYAQFKADTGYGSTNTFSNGTDLKGKPIVIFIRNGTQVFINGVHKGNISGGSSSNSNKFLVGANRTVDQPFDGWIGEVFCLNHYPYDRYQDKGTRYLMGKWGVDAHLESSNSYNDAHVLGGSGSGGSIYLKAANLVINSGVNITANGGAAAPDMDRGGNTDATDGGGEGPAAGGGGRVYLEGTTSFVNNGSVDNSNLTSTGGQSQVRQYGGTPRHGDDGTVRVVRPQVSSLEFTSGTLTVNADAGEITHSDGSFMLGEIDG